MSGLKIGSVYDEFNAKISKDLAEIAILGQEDLVSPLTSASATKSMAVPSSASKSTRIKSMFFSTPKPRVTEAFVDAGKSEIYAKCLITCLKDYFPYRNTLGDMANEEYRNKVKGLQGIDDTAKHVLIGDYRAIGQAYAELPEAKKAEVVGDNPFLKVYLDVCAAYADGELVSEEREFLKQLRTCYLAAEEYLTFASHKGMRAEAVENIQTLIGTSVGSFDEMLKTLQRIESRIPSALSALPEDFFAKAKAGKNQVAIDEDAIFRSSYRNLVSALTSLGKVAETLHKAQSSNRM